MIVTCDSKVREYILSFPHDTIFAMSDFSDFGSYDAIRKALSRCMSQKLLLGVVNGIYRLDPETFTDAPAVPSHRDVAYALARNNRWGVLPGTELARHEIGLSEKPPAFPVYLSTGPKTRVEYAPKHRLLLVHSASKIFDGFTYNAALVIIALSDLDRHTITLDEVVFLSQNLDDETKENLLKNLPLAPPRLRPIIELINNCYGRAGR